MKIIYGAGELGQRAVNFYGAGNVAYFCDTYRKGQINGIDIISPDYLFEISEKYDVVIAIERHELQREIADMLRTHNIRFSLFESQLPLMHITGIYPNISFNHEYIGNIGNKRVVNGTIPMMMDMMQKHEQWFSNTLLDFYIYVSDDPQEAYEYLKILDLSHMLAYCTCYPYEEEIIPIPDYKFYYSGLEFADNRNITENFEKILRLSEKTWQIDRAFWGGNILNSQIRKTLVFLAEKYPKHIETNGFIWDGQYVLGNPIPMIDFLNYRFIIDVRGVGWTDRIKWLLAMGRPLLIVERPYKEYYFDDIRQWDHYVPVREDLSDLIDHIELLRNNEDLCEKLTYNCRKFVKEKFTTDAVLNCLYEKTVLVNDR